MAFEFSTERIINEQYVPVKRAKGLLKDGDKLANWKGLAGKVFSVAGGTNFYPAGTKNVVAVKGYYHLPVNAVEEVAVLDCAIDKDEPQVELAKGDVIRLTIITRLDEKITALYNDPFPIHTKPFIYEAPIRGAYEDALKDLCAKVADINGMSDIEYFDIEADGTKLVISAKDEFMRFEYVSLVKVGKEGPAIDGELLTGFKDTIMIAEGRRKAQNGVVDLLADAASVEGKLGCGDVRHIIEDMRIPTRENLDFLGLHKEERPVVGAKYTQFLIEYTTEDSTMGFSVLGQRSLSTTRHSFFVINDSEEELAFGTVDVQFKKDLEAALGIELEEAAHVEDMKDYAEDPDDNAGTGSIK